VVCCTADQHQTTETTGQTFAGSCVNRAGLTGNAGWYTSAVTVETNGTDGISSPVV
jgi:hypothetical protein